MNTFISYEGLPLKFGGAHSLNKKSPYENYEETVKFIKMFGDNTEPNYVDLVLYKSDKKEYLILNLLPKLIFNFGLPKIDNQGLLRSFSWRLSKKNIQKGFDYLKVNNKLPNNSFGPFSLDFEWLFKFKSLDSDLTLPKHELIPKLDNRNKETRIYLRVSKKSTISALFNLPFEELDYIDKI